MDSETYLKLKAEIDEDHRQKIQALNVLADQLGGVVKGAILSTEQEQQIVELLTAATMSQGEIARKFGVSRHVVARIRESGPKKGAPAASVLSAEALKIIGGGGA